MRAVQATMLLLGYALDTWDQIRGLSTNSLEKSPGLQFLLFSFLNITILAFKICSIVIKNIFGASNQSMDIFAQGDVQCMENHPTRRTCCAVCRAWWKGLRPKPATGKCSDGSVKTHGDQWSVWSGGLNILVTWKCFGVFCDWILVAHVFFRCAASNFEGTHMRRKWPRDASDGFAERQVIGLSSKFESVYDIFPAAMHLFSTKHVVFRNSCKSHFLRLWWARP